MDEGGVSVGRPVSKSISAVGWGSDGSDGGGIGYSGSNMCDWGSYGDSPVDGPVGVSVRGSDWGMSDGDWSMCYGGDWCGVGNCWGSVGHCWGGVGHCWSVGYCGVGGGGKVSG